MKYISTFLFTSLAVLCLGSFTFAQETGEAKVVDEVVAQVNDDVITLSRVKREMKNAVDSFVEQGKKQDEAQKIVDEKQGELIAGLIDEQLLLQRAKELGLDPEIDADLNQRFLELMKQYKCKTVDELNALIEKSGVDPKELRENWRKEATRDKVIQREVQSKLYYSFSSKDLKDYFDKNRAKFVKPETVSFSELFLGFAGRDEKAVREKAQQLYAQLKGGADFDKMVKENGDAPVITQGRGKVEKIEFAPLNATIKTPLTGLKTGEFTAPIEIEQLGVAILRVDGREQASSDATFDDNAVRMAMLTERGPDEQKKYFAKLRDDSYIKISETFRPIVAPLLRAEVEKPKQSK